MRLSPSSPRSLQWPSRSFPARSAPSEPREERERVAIDCLMRHTSVALNGVSRAGDDRPAIVRAGLDAIHLVLAAGREESTRSVFRFIEDTCVGLERETLHVAVSEAEHR